MFSSGFLFPRIFAHPAKALLPVARAVVKRGYAYDRAQVEPVYVQPLLVQAAEPSDEEIVARLGG